MNVIARSTGLGLFISVAAACSDPSDSPDANMTPDAAPDGMIDAGSCGADRALTGELVDWFSSDASFMGVFDATVTLLGDASGEDTTAPNGRFELCVPRDPQIALTINAPDAQLDGTMVLRAADLDRLGATAPVSARLFADLAAFETFASGFGVTVDPAMAQVLVAQPLDRVDLALSVDFAMAIAGNDEANNGALTWSVGTAGDYVLFVNVDPTGDADLTTATSTHVLPTTAGAFTFTVSAETLE